MEGYCVKCRAKKTMKNPSKSKTKNGRNLMRGSCPSCGTKMVKFVK